MRSRRGPRAMRRHQAEAVPTSTELRRKIHLIARDGSIVEPKFADLPSIDNLCIMHPRSLPRRSRASMPRMLLAACASPLVWIGHALYVSFSVN